MPIRLSERVTRIKPSATLAVTARSKELVRAGKDIIGLGAGEPDFATPDHIRLAAIAAIEGGQTKYTAVDGTPELKAAIQLKLRRDNGLNYEPGQLIVSTGAKQALFNACQALLGPGDHVLVPAPYWVSYPDMVKLAGADPVVIDTDAAAGFKMTANQLAAAITPATRMLILNSPCNPTGAVYAREEQAQFGRVLARHPEIVIVSDEIYEHIQYLDRPFVSFASACPDLYDRTLIINGASKCFAMTGWRIGYAAGPAEIIAAMRKIQGQSTSNACSISQAATVAALTGDQQCVRDMCASFRERRDYVQRALAELPGVRCAPIDGAFYALPDFSSWIEHLGEIADDVALAGYLLDTAGVALVPGSAFGAPGHLRLSFAVSPESLESSIKRLRAVADKIGLTSALT